MRSPPRDVPHAVILYDGVCHLCQGSVRFIARRDRRGYFRFGALQSARGRTLAATAGLPPADPPTSIVLIEGDRAYTRSTAALRIARRLRFPWTLLGAGLLVPRPIRDAVYDWIARRRYRWFGRSDACELPPLEWRERFLDGAEP
jgi:predicted DCC family thiol-disulfide oxidoreductase YuxK